MAQAQTSPSITITETDESPGLALKSFIPIIRHFVEAAGIKLDTKDISLSSRILAAFSEYLDEDQQVNNDLTDLGEMVNRPDAVIIKAPNVSATAHLKATMMIKTDGVFFGDALEAFYADIFEKHADLFEDLNINPQDGVEGIYRALAQNTREKTAYLNKDKTQNKIRGALEGVLAELEAPEKEAFEAIFETLEELAEFKEAEVITDIEARMEDGPILATAGQDTTNLSHPGAFIMDVSMAKLAVNGGKVWDMQGDQHDTLAVIPDSTYAKAQQAGIDWFKENGALDPTTMGSFAAIRLQAGGAQEYGSKDKTFNAPSKGTFQVVAEDGRILQTHDAAEGDVWRMCITNDNAIESWTKLAIEQARQSGDPLVFWLDSNRAHDKKVIEKVNTILANENMDSIDVQIMNPEDAMKHTLDIMSQGKRVIGVVGNVLGDHTTDYFPYLEVNASTKMTSNVHLLGGGIVAETGSGGTAPMLITGEGPVKGIVNDNHFVWDDIGELAALASSLNHISSTQNHVQARILASTLNAATARYVSEQKSPSKVYDTRESQFFIAKLWAEELSTQSEDKALKDQFTTLAQNLTENEQTILEELRVNRGQKTDLGGTLDFDEEKVQSVMRPSKTLNQFITPALAA